MTEKLRVAIRGFANGVPKFVDHIEIGEDEIDELVPALARKHGAAMLAHALTMIEIEFVDEVDRSQAYFRIGTDPRGMVNPVAVDLDKRRAD
jgi:hypothetical protein